MDSFGKAGLSCDIDASLCCSYPTYKAIGCVLNSYWTTAGRCYAQCTVLSVPIDTATATAAVATKTVLDTCEIHKYLYI